MEKIENVFSQIIMESIETSRMCEDLGMIVPRHILPALKKEGLEIVRSSKSSPNSEYMPPSAQCTRTDGSEKGCNGYDKGLCTAGSVCD